jgi:hypothetical protein
MAKKNSNDKDASLSVADRYPGKGLQSQIRAYSSTQSAFDVVTEAFFEDI